MKHYSVLSNEIIDKLKLKENGIYIDATLGLGGHTEKIKTLCPKCMVISFDQDINAINYSKKRLEEYSNIFFLNQNFKNIKYEVEKLNFKKVDGIIYDLGTSFYQLTDESRGFTYHGKTKLDMRMNQDQELSAINVLNEYSEKELSNIFFKYGDEKLSNKIAKAIVEYRENNKITYNTELNEIIRSVKGFTKDKHPFKNIYQSIRIEVNNEMGVLEDSLNEAFDILKKDGIIAVITFHSLEDRIVKNIFWNKKEDIEVTEFGNIHKYKTFKVVYPSKKEIEMNKASRSAKLRTIKKLN